MPDRNYKLIGMLDLAAQEGIEIGPLNHPVVERSQGRIFYADHASTADLRRKYAADPNVPVDQIVSVDYVLGDRTIAEAVGSRQFDYAVASHVIEHVPDLIGFCNDLSKCYAPAVSCALPFPTRDSRSTISVVPRPCRM